MSSFPALLVNLAGCSLNSRSVGIAHFLLPSGAYLVLHSDQSGLNDSSTVLPPSTATELTWPVSMPTLILLHTHSMCGHAVGSSSVPVDDACFTRSGSRSSFFWHSIHSPTCVDPSFFVHASCG